jgi:hypothetical protein
MSRIVDKQSHSEVTKDNVKRRTFLKRATAGAAVLSVLSKPAFGAVGARCSISGFTSVNPSGVRHDTGGCGGLSPGAWKNPYAGNGDGSLADWAQAGVNTTGEPFYPNPSDGSAGNPGGGSSSSSTNPGTLFSELFTNSNSVYTLHDMLHEVGTYFERWAVEALLNAAFYQWGIPGPNQAKIHPADVVGLYETLEGQIYTSVVTPLSIRRPSDLDVQAFFENLIH